MSYLDTSVLTAYYCPEPRSAAVQGILSRIRRPAISPLVEVELACAVARKVRAGDMDAATARRVFDEFQRHVSESRFTVVPISQAEYDQARDWIMQLASPLRVLDGLHLATAFAHGLPMVTSDRDLARSARNLGIRHRLVP